MWKMISGIGFAIMIAMSVGKSTVAGYNAGQIAAGPAG